MSTRRHPSPAEPLLRGALFTLRRRCGKATCHCAQGDPHESPALAYPAAGRTKTLTLTQADVPEVAAALARYAKAKAQLDAAAEAQLVALRARRAGGRSTR